VTDKEMIAMLDGWIEATYPFDRAKCGFNVAEHVYGEEYDPCCEEPAHAKLRAEAKKIKWDHSFRVLDWITRNHDQLMALRTRYRKFWKETTNARKASH
jgi:hypothetical protein